MTVSTTANKVSYAGNGATTAFSFSFPGVDEDDIAVYITDSDGEITELASNLYTVTLTAAIPPNPTGIGGSVAYPLTGSPLAAGNTLTILRTLPITQPTSLANQGTSFQSVFEQALDQQTMIIQQLSELLGRQITVAVSDDDPTALPAAAERASMLMGFDADGNPIAVELTDAGEVLVSSAMIPVVEAASLALARTALGLGGLSTLGLGAGLENDGADNARVINTPSTDATGQAVVASFHTDERHASAAITYTFPAVSTLFDGFGFFIYALGGDVTLAINAGDSFSGGTAGQSLVVPQGTRVFVSTDGVTTLFVRGVDPLPYGLIQNAGLTASVAGGNLTVALVDRNGNNASTSSPIIATFRSPTATNGGPVNLAITAALSIVAASGASLGTVNGVQSKVWVVLFNDGGNPRLGLINCLSDTDIYPLGQYPVASSTQVSAGATAAQTFYTNGAAVSSKSYLVLGYLTWEIGNTIATAGVWSAAPSRNMPYGPAVKLPGETVQERYASTGTGSAALATAVPHDNTKPEITQGDTLTGLSKAITATCTAHLFEAEAQAVLGNSAGNWLTASLYNTDIHTTESLATASITAVTALAGLVHLLYRRLVPVAAATTFLVRGGANTGNTYFNGDSNLAGQSYGGANNSYIKVKEIAT